MAGNTEDTESTMEADIAEEMEMVYNNLTPRKYEDLFGVSRTIDMLKQEVVSSTQKELNKPLLIFGVPGCGKTHLVHSTAAFACVRLYVFQLWNLQSRSYRNHVEEYIKAVFRVCCKHSPSILCLEDLDVIEKSSDWFRIGKETLINEMIKLSNADIGKVTLIGTTQKPWKIDPSVLGLFSLFPSSHITLPDHVGRIGLLKAQLSQTTQTLREEDFDFVASKTHGFTGADLLYLVRNALMGPVRNLAKATHFRNVCVGSDDNLLFDNQPEVGTNCKTRDAGATNDATPDDDNDNLCEERKEDKLSQSKSSESLLKEKLIPCDANEIGAIPMSVFDIPEDKVHVADITMQDMEAALKDAKNSVTEEEVQRMALFESELC